MISGRLECRLQKLEMDGGHLWAKDRVMFAHLLGKYHPFVIGGLDHAACFLFFPNPQGGNQGTDTDARSP